MIGRTSMKHNSLKKNYNFLRKIFIVIKYGRYWWCTLCARKSFKINNSRDYHDLYVQSDTLLLADVFENFRKVCLEIYQVDCACVSWDIWAWALIKTKVKRDLLTHIDMLLMVEKLEGEKYVTPLINMQKLITNTWKIMIKTGNRYSFSTGM